jgi:hypothetical protein
MPNLRCCEHCFSQCPRPIKVNVCDFLCNSVFNVVYCVTLDTCNDVNKVINVCVDSNVVADTNNVIVKATPSTLQQSTVVDGKF